MCFNAASSFTGAAVIGVAGIGALAMTRNKREIPIAALPLGFAVHQALEGVTWMELGDQTDAMLTGWGVHAWVMFAWALLPIYVPWAVWLIETDPRRKKAMAALMVIGGALAIFMVVQALQPEIGVAIVGRQLDYKLALPFASWLLAIPYVLATCLAPGLSSHRYVMVFGIANFLAMSAAALIEARDYSSIWCTFAAFLSLIIVWHFVTQRRGPAGTEAAAAPSMA